jgi:hypothetical protein
MQQTFTGLQYDEERRTACEVLYAYLSGCLLRGRNLPSKVPGGCAKLPVKIAVHSALFDVKDQQEKRVWFQTDEI